MAAFLLGWEFDDFDSLNGPVRDETGNGIRQIEALIEGIQSKTPPGAERLTSKGRSEQQSDAVVFSREGTAKRRTYQRHGMII